MKLRAWLQARFRLGLGLFGAGLLFACALFTPISQAGVLDTVSTEHHNGRYYVTMTANVAAAPAQVWAVLTDYDRLARINPAVESVRVVSSTPEPVVTHSLIKVCVLWHCKTLDQRQTMQAGPGWRLQADVIPEHSDFSYGYARWELAPAAATDQSSNEATQLKFHAELEPAFWVPPMIGPWLIKRALEQEGRITIRGIEDVIHGDKSSQL